MLFSTGVSVIVVLRGISAQWPTTSPFLWCNMTSRLQYRKKKSRNQYNPQHKKSIFSYTLTLRCDKYLSSATVSVQNQFHQLGKLIINLTPLQFHTRAAGAILKCFCSFQKYMSDQYNLSSFFIPATIVLETMKFLSEDK